MCYINILSNDAISRGGGGGIPYKNLLKVKKAVLVPLGESYLKIKKFLILSHLHGEFTIHL